VRIWRFPDQVVRLAILLVAALVAMVVVRGRLIPDSFGLTGHYRADAVTTIASRPIRYAGSQLCVECHDSEGEIKSGSYHRTLACEVCHGAAYAHANDPEAQTPRIPRERGAACLYCHEYLPSRPTGFPQIIERLHNPLEPCIGCHNAHDPTPPEVPESCAACHAQIARTKAVSHHGPLPCETCHEVAPEHREEPRAFLPRKPTDRAFCGRCHARGAQSPSNIPRVDFASHGARYLCWQCHYPHFPEG
jgi:ribosomal protein S27AE